ncbi:hypothetical protein [Actinoallomurus sp. CA-150999]|uniref:hypothetical protein n=1 Tax=Actinoallomurus sp. CA-150999 TaxID=3239887 RepID=UPI003D8B9D45
MRTMERIRLDDGVVVHKCLIAQGEDGSWWALHDRAIMCSDDRDALLLQVAAATGWPPNLDDLRGRLDRAIARALRERAEDEVLNVRREMMAP